MDTSPIETAALVARVQNLSKSYGKEGTRVDALRDVTLGIRRGEFTAIMGPSGSGKSTLMHIMAGLDAPTSGRVWLGDAEIGGMSDAQLTVLRRRRVGFVFQSFNLVPTLDVEGNLLLPFELDGRRYCHILDPRSGMPVTQWQTVSVLAPLALVAGHCSTVAMLLQAEGLRFLEASGMDFLAIDQEGHIHLKDAATPRAAQPNTQGQPR